MVPRVQRERVLTLIANQLYELGFRQMHAKCRLRPETRRGPGEAVVGRGKSRQGP